MGLTDLLLQIIDGKGNILPPNTEGKLGIRIKPTRPFGMFMCYEVRGPCLPLPGPRIPALLRQWTQLCILRLLHISLYLLQFDEACSPYRKAHAVFPPHSCPDPWGPDGVQRSLASESSGLGANGLLW